MGDKPVKNSSGRALYGSREIPKEHSLSAPTNTTVTTGKPRPPIPEE